MAHPSKISFLLLLSLFVVTSSTLRADDAELSPAQLMRRFTQSDLKKDSPFYVSNRITSWLDAYSLRPGHQWVCTETRGDQALTHQRSFLFTILDDGYVKNDGNYPIKMFRIDRDAGLVPVYDANDVHDEIEIVKDFETPGKKHGIAKTRAMEEGNKPAEDGSYPVGSISNLILRRTRREYPRRYEWVFCDYGLVDSMPKAKPRGVCGYMGTMAERYGDCATTMRRPEESPFFPKSTTPTIKNNPRYLWSLLARTVLDHVVTDSNSLKGHQTHGDYNNHPQEDELSVVNIQREKAINNSDEPRYRRRMTLDVWKNHDPNGFFWTSVLDGKWASSDAQFACDQLNSGGKFFGVMPPLKGRWRVPTAKEAKLALDNGLFETYKYFSELIQVNTVNFWVQPTSSGPHGSTYYVDTEDQFSLDDEKKTENFAKILESKDPSEHFSVRCVNSNLPSS